MLTEELRRSPAVHQLAERMPSAIAGGSAAKGEITLLVDPEQIAAVCRFLKEEHAFNRLSSVTAVDWYPAVPRFEVVYHLHSLPRGERLRLKCRLAEGAAIDSVTGVWRGADWYEREVYDLFGIPFRGHPNLKRIMMPEDWEGHPLRKDYPVHGFKYGYQER